MVDGGKPVVDSRDEGKHTEGNDLLFVGKMMWMDQHVRPKMKSECCEEEAELCCGCILIDSAAFARLTVCQTAPIVDSPFLLQK